MKPQAALTETEGSQRNNECVIVFHYLKSDPAMVSNYSQPILKQEAEEMVQNQNRINPLFNHFYL